MKVISEIPNGGVYDISSAATNKLINAIKKVNDSYTYELKDISPSYCSGATYLVFCKALSLYKNVKLKNTYDLLQIHSKLDGVGLWGRWNSNGPGTACLIKSLNMGINFDQIELAQPGDFMKIFWTNEVGMKEKGHSVIFLKTTKDKIGTWVHFWSSNKSTNGYGEKKVLLNKIKWQIFTRITTPLNIINALSIPKCDNYLKSMLKVTTNKEEVTIFLKNNYKSK